MPELPEVETIVKDLAPKIVGKKIINVYSDTKSKAQAIKIQKHLKNKNITSLTRYGKYIFFQIQKDFFLIAHLRMTGKFVYPADDKNQSAHQRITFILDNGKKLAFCDVRRFGTFEIFLKKEYFLQEKKLGVDALSDKFQFSLFFNLLKLSNSPIKNFLLNQQKIAGIGNIYACEILYKSKIFPYQKASTLTKQQAKKLFKDIQTILKLAIKKAGTSISDYTRIDEKTGEFQKFLKVYQRKGEKCFICKEKIQKDSFSRSTYYCPSCQIKTE